MKFSLFTDYGSLNSPPVWDAVKLGLLKLGHTVDENNIDTDIPVIWSLLWHGRMIKNKIVWDKFRSQNKKVLVIEVGGIKRNSTWKVGINGINRLADFGPKNNDDTRVAQLGLDIRPWRTQGEHILLCLQHDKSEQWKNMPPLEQYVLETVQRLRQHTDRKIIVRSHPRCILPAQLRLDNVVYEIPKQIDNTYDDFDLNFSNAWAVVSWSSNPGIHAVLNGIPAFVGEQSLAYDVANHDFSTINSPKTPDRQQWLNDYVHTEWTTEEIAQGIPFSRLTF
jgi:hypothetical protein